MRLSPEFRRVTVQTDASFVSCSNRSPRRKWLVQASALLVGICYSLASAQSMAGTLGQSYVSPNAPKPMIALTQRAQPALSEARRRLQLTDAPCPVAFGHPAACGTTAFTPAQVPSRLSAWRLVTSNDISHVYQVGPLQLIVTLIRTDAPGTPYYERTLVVLADYAERYPEPLSYLLAPGAPAYPGILKLTAPRISGKSVLAFQKKLREHGVLDGGTPDGFFGPKTMAAVRHFQRYTGQPVTGTVNALTWATAFSR